MGSKHYYFSAFVVWYGVTILEQPTQLRRHAHLTTARVGMPSPHIGMPTLTYSSKPA